MSFKRSDDISNLAKAFAAAQGEFTNPPREKTVRVRMKSGGHYEYQYAPLDTIMDTVRPILAKHKLSVLQPMHVDEDGKLILQAILLHETGDWVSAEMPVANKSDIKDLGGDITYKRRYLVTSLLGLTPDDDMDAPPTSETQSIKASATPRAQRSASKNKPNGDKDSEEAAVIEKTISVLTGINDRADDILRGQGGASVSVSRDDLEELKTIATKVAGDEKKAATLIKHAFGVKPQDIAHHQLLAMREFLGGEKAKSEIAVVLRGVTLQG